MVGASRSPCSCPVVHRVFEFSRLGPQLLALAYQELLPIIRSPVPARQAVHAGRAGATQTGPMSFQEEQDLETL